MMQERAGQTEQCACAGYRRRMWKQVRTRPCPILIESKLGPNLLFYRDFRAVKCSISLEITLDCPQFLSAYQCASSQFLPIPISTSSGTDSFTAGSAAPDIIVRITAEAASK